MPNGLPLPSLAMLSLSERIPDMFAVLSGTKGNVGG
jgi:hypothetical protein